MKNNRGQILIQVLIFATIAVLFVGGLTGWAGISIRAGNYSFNRELALQIAEAGTDYYRWHLAHDQDDYQDGTGAPGPYTHNFTNKVGTVIGQFILDITPPPSGSTIVTIKSTGKVNADPNISRVIETTLAIPSLAKYSVGANDEMRFGEGTEVYGPIHSNYGIRFDGIAHNLVTSAVSEYNDPDHASNKEFGVHTHKNTPPPGVNEAFRPLEALPNPVQNRSDVFYAGRQFPVVPIDFTGLTADLAQIKTDAQTSGRYFAASGAQGYHIVLKTNDTFDIYRVNTLYPVPNGCTQPQGQQWWGTWSINSGGETFLANYAFPSNGLIFTEDNVWVDGQINTARITIASGRFPDNPAQRKSITINNDLLYTNYDGQDAIALIAQGNVNAGLLSEDDLRIDAALIAQNGRIGRYYYRPADGNPRCSPYDVRQVLTLYGILVTNERYGFAYDDGTGYQIRNIIYDANLLYGPPPSFPLTSDQYTTISWEEVE